MIVLLSRVMLSCAVAEVMVWLVNLASTSSTYPMPTARPVGDSK